MIRPQLLSAAALAAILAWAPARAQTLAEALALAYANNPTLQAARAALRATDENVPQALSGWRPTVTLSANAGIAEGYARSVGAGGPVTRDTDRTPAGVTATIVQPLYRGGRTEAQLRRAENQVLAARARLLATEQAVLRDTVSAYVAVIRDEEEVRLNRNNVTVLTRQLQATQERFRVGEITRTDVAQAESRLAGARAQLAEAEGRLQNSRALFARLVGQPPGRLTAPQPVRPPVGSAEEARRMAMMNNPSVVAALFDEAAARDFIDVQMAALLPQANLQAQAFRNDNSAQPLTRTTGQQITATITVPLYQGGAEYSAVRQARQDAQRLRQVVDEQRRLAAQQANEAWESLLATRATVTSVRAQINAAEIALDGVRREAVVGNRTTLDVLNAEQELLNARVALVRALANQVTASHALAAAVGRLTARDLRLPVAAYDMEAYYNAVRNRWAGLSDPTGGN
ncbi:MAG: TolC family outer membrane protein [Acetobacteraceae bacterium]|nr:TolC family outer membrane protein [Acetobacteraceae bacterium]